MASTIGNLPGTEELVEFLRQQALKQGPKTMGGVPTAQPSALLEASAKPTGVPSRMYTNPQIQENLPRASTGTAGIRGVSPQVAEAASVPRALAGAAPRGGGLLNTALMALAYPAGQHIGNWAVGRPGDTPLGASDYEAELLRHKDDMLPDISAADAAVPPKVANDRMPYSFGGMTGRLPQPAPNPAQALAGSEDMRIKLPEMTPQPAVDLEVMPEEEVVQEEAAPQTSTIDQHIEQLLAQRQPIPQEVARPESANALAELSAPKKVEKPKEGLGRKIKRFMVAGSGPFDFTRLDRQELALAEAQQALTEREKLRAQMALTDQQGAQDFNRKAKLHDYESGGMSPQDTFQLGLLGNDRKAAREHGYKGEELGQEHGFRMEEIKAGAANQRMSPEQAQREQAAKLMQEYPDLFTPEQIMQHTGLQTNPEALQVIANARKKTDMVDLMLAELLRGKLGGAAGGMSPSPAGRSAAPAGNLNLRALQK